MQRGMEAISLWHCSGVMEVQVALIAAFRSYILLSLVSLIFLLKIPNRLSVEGVNYRLLDHCQVSSVPHYCGFKEQEIPTIYTVWVVIY